MAMQGSGMIKLSQMAAEFGDSTPYQMSEYYGGGSLVPAGANPGVATSGMIKIAQFYGSVAATVLTISSNTNNYDIGAAAISAGGDKSTPVILTINSGVTVGSTSSGTAAMRTGTGWSSGTTITITNNGSIIGSSGSNTSSQARGGNGGASYLYQNGYNGAAGTAGSGSADAANNGGNAFEHSQTADNNLSVTFSTTGTRTGGSSGSKTMYGGGGGGGGGRPGRINNCYGAAHYSGGGGGGGQGTPNSSGGASHASAGGAGTSTSRGSGGGGGPNAGAGGNGGTLGNSGSTGGQGNGYNYPGGGGGGGSNGNANGSSGSALSGNTGQIN
jgi:hypothetical protein